MAINWPWVNLDQKTEDFWQSEHEILEQPSQMNREGFIGIKLLQSISFHP